MAGNTSHNIRHVDLDDPDREALAAVLEEALRDKYTTSSVEWVPCPNLSKPPFNLAAKGISGNTALLDFGDMSHLEIPAFAEKKLNFKKVLKDIGRDNNNSFIFGHGVYQKFWRGYILRELVLNTLFSSSTNVESESRNRSQFLNLTSSYRCNLKKLSLPELACTGQGTYFLCDGSTTNAFVLKVHAAVPLTSNTLLSASKEFITSMQKALETRFGSNHFVALGGVFTVNTKNNEPWKHRVDPHNWEEYSSVARNFHCEVISPETMITTFNSSTQLYPKNSEPPINLNSSTSIHSLSHHSASLKHPVFSEDNWGNIYEGYFCPATTLYRIDEPAQ